MQHRQALDQVGQLAHVARPFVAGQRLQRFGSEAHFATAGAGQLRGDGFHQRRQVLTALAQRGHFDREHVEAVEQILAELALGDAGLQVAVGRGHHAHVAADGLVATDALEAAFLQHAQQLHLHRQAHVADLVEQQGAAFGHFETALARGQCASEGTLFVAEQLAFQQVRRNGAAIDRHERAITARRTLVDRARHHFLAGAGFAQHQHGGVERGHLFDHGAQRGDRRAVAGRSLLLRGTGLVLGIQALEAGAAQQRFHLRMAQRGFQRPDVGFVQAMLLRERSGITVGQQYRRRQAAAAQPVIQRGAGGAVVQAADDHRHPVVLALSAQVEVGCVGHPARVEVHEFQQGNGALRAHGVVVQHQDARFAHDCSSLRPSRIGMTSWM